MSSLAFRSADLKPTSFTSSGTSTPNSPNSYFSVPTPLAERSLLLNDADEGKTFEDSHSADGFTLITGGLGFIGSHTTWELLKDGHNVVIIDNLSNSYLTVLERLRQMTNASFAGSKFTPQIDFFEADYRDSRTMRSVLARYNLPLGSSRITGVIHFAAYKAVEESIRHPLRYYANNVAGLVDFCALLGDLSIKTFIFSSSATVYGELANSGEKLSEDMVDSKGCRGLTNPYGRTKWMCEAILSDLAQSDPAWNIFALRYFNPVGCDVTGLLGEDPRGTPNNLMPVLIQAVTAERSVLSIYGSDWDTRDGTAIRDFIHVSDLARGHLAAREAATRTSSTLKRFQVFNLGTGNGQTVTEVVAAMSSVIGRTVPTELIGRRHGDVGICIADASKAAKFLAWTACKTVRQSCRDIVRFLKIEVSGG